MLENFAVQIALFSSTVLRCPSRGNRGTRPPMNKNSRLLIALAALSILAAAEVLGSDAMPAHRVLGNDSGKVAILNAAGSVE
jgi:hypothetical protein